MRRCRALCGVLRGAVDAEWLQDGITHLFGHIALQDHAAIDDRDHMIEDHCSRRKAAPERGERRAFRPCGRMGPSKSKPPEQPWAIG